LRYLQACKKDSKPVTPVDTGTGGTDGGTTVILPQTDPALAASQGFFWMPGNPKPLIAALPLKSH
jgi:hypothetical protein